MKRTLLAFGIGWLTFAGLFGGEPETRDGNWWMAQSKSFKIVYMIGLIDGGSVPYLLGCENAEKMSARLFAAAKVGQLVDGLDHFYADFRNRTIQPPAATVCVAMAINGAPSENIAVAIEHMRREIAGIATPTAPPKIDFKPDPF